MNNNLTNLGCTLSAGISTVGQSHVTISNPRQLLQPLDLTSGTCRARALSTGVNSSNLGSKHQKGLEGLTVQRSRYLKLLDGRLHCPIYSWYLSIVQYEIGPPHWLGGLLRTPPPPLQLRSPGVLGGIFESLWVAQRGSKLFFCRQGNTQDCHSVKSSITHTTPTHRGRTFSTTASQPLQISTFPFPFLLEAPPSHTCAAC